MKTFYINYETWQWQDAGRQVVSPPSLLYNTVEAWMIYFVDSAGVAVDLSNAVSWKQDAFVLSAQQNRLVEEFSGLLVLLAKLHP